MPRQHFSFIFILTSYTKITQKCIKTLYRHIKRTSKNGKTNKQKKPTKLELKWKWKIKK